MSSYTGSKYLIELDITYIELKNYGIQLLNSLISEDNLKIFKFNISKNFINKDGREDLFNLISKLSKSLRSLNISHNELENLDDLPVGRYLEELIATNINLQQYSPPPHLLRLDLSNNSIKFAGANILSQYLKTDPMLLYLNLNNNNLKSEEINILILGLTENYNLKSLHLANNKADAEAIICLIANQDHINVEEIDLSENLIPLMVFEFLVK